MKRYLLIPAIALAMASLACSFTFTLPEVTQLKTGPTETVTINESLPKGGAAVDVKLKMGAATLKLTGGAAGLAEGTITYNVAEWKPVVTRGEGKLSLEQGLSEGNVEVSGGRVVNDWDLKLGDAPINLSIDAGAYRGALDLSGLRLRSLNISEGASESAAHFDRPNPEEMDKLTYNTGASKVTLTGLANANFAEMTFKGGAGDYTLDFSGELQRDATVSIETGVSNMRLEIPSGTAAKVTITGGVKNVSPIGAWTIHGDTYETGGTGKTLTVTVNMGVGSLTLVSK